MFRAYLFLATLLLMAEALRLPFFRLRQEPPPTPIPIDPQLMRMLMFWMPFTSMFMAFRAVDMSLMTGALMSKFTMMSSVADSVGQNFGVNGLLTQGTNFMSMITNLTQSTMQQNSCVFKLACELALGRQQASADTAQEMMRRQMQMPTESDMNKNVVVNMNFDGGMVEQQQDNPCERRFSSCPFGLDDLLRMRRRFQDFWGRFYNRPRTVIVEEDDGYGYDYYDY